MFLKNIDEHELPDADVVEENFLYWRLKYKQELQKDFRNRFRSVYLGFCIQWSNGRQCQRSIAAENIVFVGANNKIRINWSLGHVTERIRGKGGKVHLMELQAFHAQILRPIFKTIILWKCHRVILLKVFYQLRMKLRLSLQRTTYLTL